MREISNAKNFNQLYTTSKGNQVMLLHTIAHYLNEEVKLSNGSKQVHFSAPAEELVFVDEQLLPYTVRLIGNANQVVVIDKANADEKGLKPGFVLIYKTPAMNFEDMPDLHKGIELILKAAKVNENLTEAAGSLIHWPIAIAEDIKPLNARQVTEDQGQMHDTPEP